MLPAPVCSDSSLSPPVFSHYRMFCNDYQFLFAVCSLPQTHAHMLDFFDRYDILDSDFVERQKKGHTTAGMILFLSFFYQNTRSAVLLLQHQKGNIL